MAFLTEARRRTVLERVLRTIDRKFMGPPPDVHALRERHGGAIAKSETAEDFESAMAALLRDLGASHTGFFHERRPRAAGRVAIAATFMKADTVDGERWLFQDVHPGGVAAAAGIRAGDTLLAVDGRDLVPPNATPFALGRIYTVTVRGRSGVAVRHTITVPSSRERQRPIVVPEQVVTTTRLGGDVGVVRVSMFPGVLGIEVARDISRAVAALSCDRLIFDLRGNTGGGIGCLRIMSLLCPGRSGVGYTVGRQQGQRGYEKDRLPAFDRIPSSKWGVVPLIVRLAFSGRSVAVYTERLGAQQHHGRTVVLVNEHSASAAEMVAGFASEYGVATVVGTRTAGRLVATSAFKVGFGYRLALPVAAYFTWRGTNLEGLGVEPDLMEPLSPAALWEGNDNQLARAKAYLTA